MKSIFFKSSYSLVHQKLWGILYCLAMAIASIFQWLADALRNTVWVWANLSDSLHDGLWFPCPISPSSSLMSLENYLNCFLFILSGRLGLHKLLHYSLKAFLLFVCDLPFKTFVHFISVIKFIALKLSMLFTCYFSIFVESKWCPAFITDTHK